MHALALRGFYAILDVKDDGQAAADEVLGRAEELLLADPCCLQLRAKRLPAGPLRELARRVGPLCRARKVPFCVNDRLDVALAAEADVVHVGQEDLPLGEVRRLVAAAGRPMWVGVSTHNPAQAQAAVAAGADYIGFGPIFATGTKERPDPVVGLDALAAVTAAVSVPVVAIGGITRARVAAVAAAGASAAAVIADLERAPSRTAAGREVAAAFAELST